MLLGLRQRSQASLSAQRIQMWAWLLKLMRHTASVTKVTIGRRVPDASVLALTLTLLLVRPCNPKVRFRRVRYNYSKGLVLSSSLLRFLRFQDKWKKVASFRRKSWGKSRQTCWLSAKPGRRDGLWGLGCSFCAHLVHSLASNPEQRKALPERPVSFTIHI